MPSSFGFDFDYLDYPPSHPSRSPNLLDDFSIQVTYDRMADILLKMENVLSISNKGRALSKSLHSHVNGLAGENRPILQPKIEVPNWKKQKFNEATEIAPE